MHKAGEKLVAELGKHSLLIHADLTRAEDCAESVAQAIKQFGKSTPVVNNAGINDRVGLEHGRSAGICGFTPAQSPPLLQHGALRAATSENFSWRDVNIASKTAVTGQGGTPDTRLLKAPILALTREWAVELLPYSSA